MDGWIIHNCCQQMRNPQFAPQVPQVKPPPPSPLAKSVVYTHNVLGCSLYMLFYIWIWRRIGNISEPIIISLNFEYSYLPILDVVLNVVSKCDLSMYTAEQISKFSLEIGWGFKAPPPPDF